ncbi:hypothetical protein GJAV_G00085840 [Gymnothorax javanicus]|nr:hypothetical protein GJAV_G00085840 [Gymnothorax javanicus]
MSCGTKFDPTAAFGTSKSSGGLFGTTNTNSSPFRGTSGSLFGSSGFTATQTGTTLKFNPPRGSDTLVKGGVTISINTKHQCISAMREYENKSLEELRLEDYQAGRKGPSNPMGARMGMLFGAAATSTLSTTAGLFGSSATNTGFSFGQNKTTFGTSTGGFGTATGSLFGQQQRPQQGTSLFSKPFGQATAAPNTSFSFGSANAMGQPNTSRMVGLFGSNTFNQPVTSSTSTGFGFVATSGTSNSLFGSAGTGGGLFSQPNNAFGANKPAAFGMGKVNVLVPVQEPKTREDFLQSSVSDSSQLTLDPNTAHQHLSLSEGNREATNVGQTHSYPDHPERFELYAQVLCREGLSGRCYWEAEWSGDGVYIAVSYKEISRKGLDDDCILGYNNKSWCLYCSRSSYSFLHNNKSTEIPVPSSSRIRVYLDHRAGTLSFYSVSDTMTLLHGVQTTFTQPLYPAFWVGAGSSVKLCDLR